MRLLQNNTSRQQIYSQWFHVFLVCLLLTLGLLLSACGETDSQSKASPNPQSSPLTTPDPWPTQISITLSTPTPYTLSTSCTVQQVPPATPTPGYTFYRVACPNVPDTYSVDASGNYYGVTNSTTGHVCTIGLYANGLALPNKAGQLFPWSCSAPQPPYITPTVDTDPYMLIMIISPSSDLTYFGILDNTRVTIQWNGLQIVFDQGNSHLPPYTAI